MIDRIRTMFRSLNPQRGYGVVEYAFAFGILVMVGLTAMSAADHVARPAIEQVR